MVNTTNELIAENNPNRIASLPAETSVPGWGEAKQATETVGKALYEAPSFKGAVQTKDEMVRELYEYDKALESKWGQSPTTQMAQEMYGSEFVSHPGDIAAGQAGYATGLGRTIGTSQAAIGDVSGYYESAMSNVMNKFLDWLQITENRKQREEDRTFEREKFERQMALEEKKLAQGPTLSFTERKYEEQQRIMDEIAPKAKNYTNLDTLIKEYGTQVDPSEILRVYNTVSPFGVAKESAEKLYEKYRITPPERAPKMKSAEDEKADRNVITAFQDLRDIGSKNVSAMFNPVSTTGQYLQTKTNVLTQLLAKLVEKNRLSDSDRIFYLSQTRPQVLDLAVPGKYEARLNGVIDSLKAKLGISGEERSEWEVVE